MGPADLIPTACAGCRVPGALLCDSCTRAILRSEPPSTGTPLDGRLVAVGAFEGPLRRAILALKYGEATALAAELAGLLAGAYRAQHGPAPVRAVAAVPTARARRRRRGFDQAELLAEALARVLEVPFVRVLCRERAASPPQTRLDGHDRRLLPPGTFMLDSPPVSPMLIVDDVVTTGATMLAALRPLEGAGADVACAALAVTSRPGAPCLPPEMGA